MEGNTTSEFWVDRGGALFDWALGSPVGALTTAIAVYVGTCVLCRGKKGKAEHYSKIARKMSNQANIIASAAVSTLDTRAEQIIAQATEEEREGRQQLITKEVQKEKGKTKAHLILAHEKALKAQRAAQDISLFMPLKSTKRANQAEEHKKAAAKEAAQAVTIVRKVVAANGQLVVPFQVQTAVTQEIAVLNEAVRSTENGTDPTEAAELAITYAFNILTTVSTLLPDEEQLILQIGRVANDFGFQNQNTNLMDVPNL